MPLREFHLIIAGIAVHHFDVGRIDVDRGDLAPNVRRRKKYAGIEDDVVVRDLDTRDAGGIHDVGYLNVKGSQQALHRDLQEADLLDMKTNIPVGEGR